MEKRLEKIIVGIIGISLGIISGMVIDRISGNITPENWMIGHINPIPLIILAIIWIIYIIKKVKDKKNI